MNHASREILGRTYDAKFPCLLHASVISLDLQSEFLHCPLLITFLEASVCHGTLPV